MTAPNTAAITESLERSLQNCSLNHHHHHHHRHQNRGFSRERGDRSSSSSFAETPLMEEFGENQNNLPIINFSSSSDTTLELNSHVSLPYHWEQCLDLKTGEIYYINWRNGMKAKEDPRLTATTTAITEEEYDNGDFYSEDEISSYDSEESSSEYSSPPSSSRDQEQQNYRQQQQQIKKKKEEQEVLVVAGCKSCLMYFMVPKQVEDCPKCNGQLLHFDRSENGSP